MRMDKRVMQGRTVIGPGRQQGIALVAIVGVVAVAAAAVVVSSLDSRALKAEQNERAARSQADLADGLLAWASMGVPKGLDRPDRLSGASTSACVSLASSGLRADAVEALTAYGASELCPPPPSLRPLAGGNRVAPAPRLSTPMCGGAGSDVGVEGGCWDPDDASGWLTIDGGAPMAFLVVPPDWQPGEGVALRGVRADAMMARLSLRARVQLWGALDTVLDGLSNAQLEGLLLNEPACTLGGLINGADACFSPSLLPADRAQLVGVARLRSALPPAHADWLLRDAIEFPAIKVDTPRGETTLPAVAQPPAQAAAGKVEFSAAPGRAVSAAVRVAAPGLERAAAARAEAAARGAAPTKSDS